MFEGLVTLSLSSLRIHHWENGEVDEETTFHYGHVLRRLQQALGEGNALHQTAVLWAILALIELEVRSP
jgi:hypothetical protein